MTTLEPKTNLRPSVSLSLAAPASTTALSAPSLAKAVQAAVHALDESTLRPVARRDAGLAFQPKPLLALLAYCYARQIYGSADIEDLLRRDVHFRELCHNEFPGALAIRRFRRDNREAVHLCLKAALHFLVEQKVEAGAVTRVSDVQLAEEARRRIIMALFIDSMELDEN